MFFVFNFLVFAYITLSEINCFSPRSIRTTNYVSEHDEIALLRGAVQSKRSNHNDNNINTNLKSNVFEKILTNEMLSVENKYDVKETSNKPIPLSSKNLLVTPTLIIKQRWPMFKYINNAEDIETKVKSNDEYLESLQKHTKTLELEANKLTAHDAPNYEKVSWVKSEIGKSSKGIPFSKKVVEMRSVSDKGGNDKCNCKETNPSSLCKCSSSNHNKKRCTHATPNARVHECSRYGAVTNHSCSQGQPFQNLVTSNPYSFYPVYVPYTYFASEAPVFPYTFSYPQPNLISDLKIPRKHKHKCRKPTTRFEDDLYYEDNDSRERKPYDDNEYYQESKKESTKGIVYDVNQDALIKEIVKDLKIHNNKEFVKECYCDSSLSTCRSNILVVILTLLCFPLQLARYN